MGSTGSSEQLSKTAYSPQVVRKHSLQMINEGCQGYLCSEPI